MTDDSPQIQSSHRAYTDLADYAAQQGAPEAAFVDAGYHIVSHYDSISRTKRPAFCFPTARGKRYRWIDGLPGNKYTSQLGYKRCWYGLERAVTLAQETGQPLVLVNGEAGTVVAHWHGIPACCVTGGEKRSLPENLLAELLAVYSGAILIAFDNDDTGRPTSAALAGQLQTAGLTARAVNLSLPNNGGDIADFCKVHREHAAKLLADLPTLEAAPVVFQQRETTPPQPVAADDQRAARYAEIAIDNLLAELAATRTNRNNAGFRIGCKIYGFILGGWPGVSARDIECRLEEALEATELPEQEIRSLIRSIQYQAKPRPLELPDRPRNVQSATNKRQKVRRPSHQQDMDTDNIHIDNPSETIPVRYVSDDLTPDDIAATKTLLIQAATGTGKTHAIAAYANALPNDTQLTGVAQFRLLTQSLRHTIHNSSHYSDSDSHHQHALSHESRLVSSVSSLYKFNRQGGVVIADEIEGVLQFVLNSRTFSDDGAVQAYRAFKTLIQGADQVIGMDANLSDITTEWIRGLRGEVLVKRYRRTDRRGKVTFLSSPYATIQKIGKLLARQQGSVYVPCSSEETASQVTDWYMEQGYKVMKITTDTSNTPPVQAFIQSPENRQDYDLVVYTAAMGAGVDISEPVYAIVGIFTQSPLTPGDAIQLFGRVRNAKHYFAAVPNTVDGYATPNVSKLLADRLLREQNTAQRLTRSSAASGEQLEMLQLWAQFEERRQRETARWRQYFAARLKANGYTVAANNAKPSKTFTTQWSTWLETRNETGWQIILAAQGQALPDGDLDKLKLAGHEITRDLKLRNTRYKIEQALHHENVTDQDRDLVKTLGRKRLFRLTDLVSESAELLAADAQENDEGVPLAQRLYRHFDYEVSARLFSMIGLNGSPETQFLAFTAFFQEKQTATTISERFAAFGTPEALDRFQALGHRGNNARTVTGLCRWFLKYFGISLHSEQTGRGPDRQMTYWIDADHLAYRLERARTRVRYAAAHRTKNVQSQTHKHIFSAAPRPSFFSCPATEWERPVSAHNPVLAITDD